MDSAWREPAARAVRPPGKRDRRSTSQESSRTVPTSPARLTLLQRAGSGLPPSPSRIPVPATIALMSSARGFPQRIVCLTEETTETLYLLGEERRIVGISGYTVRPARARIEKPKVSSFLSAKIGRILELQPDLVLGFSDLQADIARELAKAGMNVMIFNQRSVSEILSMILTLSAMV